MLLHERLAIFVRLGPIKLKEAVIARRFCRGTSTTAKSETRQVKESPRIMLQVDERSTGEWEHSDYDLRLQAFGVERVLLGVSGVIWYLCWRRCWCWGPEGGDLENDPCFQEFAGIDKRD